MTLSQLLADFNRLPLAEAARNLLADLGYKSDRTIDLPSSKPEDFLEMIMEMGQGTVLDRDKALFDDWKSANLLFQLTGDSIGNQRTLRLDDDHDKVVPGLLQSYLFFAVELNGDNYSRSRLTGVVRQLNRVFPMPVMVLVKHMQKGVPSLSVAVINRVQNKREASKDVLGKVTIIQGISLTDPHRGHLDILESLRFTNLRHPEKLPITNFDTLHAAWEQIFNVELLNERFYKELANWYFWAMRYVEFPDGKEADAEKRKATSLIRLLTRLMFCWFLKEKELIPAEIFDEAEVRELLVELEPDSSTFHEAILQNLFFGTLNQRMGAAEDGQPYRAFAKDEGFEQNKATYGVDTLLRYESHFRDPNAILKKLASVPFLNGGLFECLDRIDENTGKKIYVDGFSRNPNRRPVVPNRLFFEKQVEKVDLSGEYGQPNRRSETVHGLIHILNKFKFTIVENTPLDQEIALDPELLGKVFENLLASYNEETKSTARKQTGSFYTPRPIVDYIVDESLKSYLVAVLTREGVTEGEALEGVQALLAYTDEPVVFKPGHQNLLLDAIHNCKILDPACGSGAFPMGMLHKLVHVIHKLDPGNQKWKQLQLDAAQLIPDSSARDAAVSAIEEAFNENDADYGRKLYLIENCLYGADIQPIAIQISKLRFFISLIVDQRENHRKENRGIRPLPNLETKFVVANTLLALDFHFDASDLFAVEARAIENQIASKYHDHFNVRNRKAKLQLQREIKQLRNELAKTLGSIAGNESTKIANWDPFDQQNTADFFDPHWMFGQTLADGFDIVFGNPPYVQIQKLSEAVKRQLQAFPAVPGQAARPRFETYDAMGDIYCLFYERGAQLLKSGGTLSYITSNKWMRAGYGEALRDFFSRQVRVRQVVDFGGNLVFSSAMVDTVVVVAEKAPPVAIVPAVVIPMDCDIERELSAYVSQNSIHLSNTWSGEATWVVLSPERQRIKALVEAQGVPLEKWDISIYRGVLTGFNEAFYITNDQKEAFCREDPRCAEALVPLLTGADIKRYGADWNQTWMINSHNGVRAIELPRVQLERDYPVLWKHLLTYEDQLKRRQDQGDHWSNLRNCAYVAEFAKPKIMYANMTKYLPFYFDACGDFFGNQKCFIVTSNTVSLPYLTAVLNSTVFRCCFIDAFPNLGEDRRELSKIFMDKIPVRKHAKGDPELFEPLVGLVQLARKAGDEVQASFLEDLIDACVMECYFRDHMAKCDLLFHERLRPLLNSYDPKASTAEQTRFLQQFCQTVNAPTHPCFKQLTRLIADSPDLLAVIKRYGAV